MEEVKIKPTPRPKVGETIVTKPTPMKTNEEERANERRAAGL